MEASTLPWIMFVAYIAAITGLALWNRRASTSMAGFAVGSRSIPPVFVGLSLAANMTSVATFVINPGLVYAYGWSGIVAYALAAPLGIFIGLVFFSRRFRQVGDKVTALTLPQWIGERYGDPRLTVLFGGATLLQITFLVLIVTALAHILMGVLGIGVWVALILIVGFTFTTILMGGASLHVWSNSIQALIMVVVTVILLFSAIPVLTDGPLFERLATVAPHFASATNPDSILFRDYFEVVIANFFIGLAIIMQPHIMSKALYLRTERDVNVYLITAVVVGTLFTAVMLVGLVARLELGGGLAPDTVMASYITTSFGPAMTSVIMLGLLAAGFSTLEGVALALSTILANDLWGRIAMLRGADPKHVAGRLVKVSRVILVLLAPVVLLLSWRQVVAPDLSVAIFGQNGVYGLFAASFAPVLFGIFNRRVSAAVVGSAAATALLIHFGMFYSKVVHYATNPAVPAVCALAVSTLIVGLGSRKAEE
jgi:sodium/pantothenate symporter